MVGLCDYIVYNQEECSAQWRLFAAIVSRQWNSVSTTLSIVSLRNAVISQLNKSST